MTGFLLTNIWISPYLGTPLHSNYVSRRRDELPCHQYGVRQSVHTVRSPLVSPPDFFPVSRLQPTTSFRSSRRTAVGTSTEGTSIEKLKYRVKSLWIRMGFIFSVTKVTTWHYTRPLIPLTSRSRVLRICWDFSLFFQEVWTRCIPRPPYFPSWKWSHRFLLYYN